MANLISKSYIISSLLCILLHLRVFVHALPVYTEISTNSNSDLESMILSALKSRVRREAPAPPSALGAADEAQTEPKTAAHYAQLASRSYGPVLPPPKLLIPSYYYRPRVFIRVPEDYYEYPRSDLWRMRPGSTNYIDNLLPIFKKETPTAKVDPVPSSQLPQQRPDNFPFWNTQVRNWVWPDGINTGALPSALFGLQTKEQNSVELAQLSRADAGQG